ncbi:MAG: hypothetical protein LBE91_01835, partial [Tannerella sp.]|nr:hypothetical protein [Tannerella sp.]
MNIQKTTQKCILKYTKNGKSDKAKTQLRFVKETLCCFSQTAENHFSYTSKTNFCKEKITI